MKINFNLQNCALSWNKIRDILLITTTVHTFCRVNLYLAFCKKKKKQQQQQQQQKMINLHIKMLLILFFRMPQNLV